MQLSHILCNNSHLQDVQIPQQSPFYKFFIRKILWRHQDSNPWRSDWYLLARALHCWQVLASLQSITLPILVSSALINLVEITKTTSSVTGNIMYPECISNRVRVQRIHLQSWATRTTYKQNLKIVFFFIFLLLLLEKKFIASRCWTNDWKEAFVWVGCEWTNRFAIFWLFELKQVAATNQTFPICSRRFFRSCSETRYEIKYFI